MIEARWTIPMHKTLQLARVEYCRHNTTELNVVQVGMKHT